MTDKNGPERVNLHGTTDATVWAEEWLKAISNNPNIPHDEGTMIGWFANAIMAGHDAAVPVGELEELITRLAIWMDQAEEEHYIDAYLNCTTEIQALIDRHKGGE